MKGKYFPIIFEILGIIFVCAISYFSGTTLFSDGVNLAAGKFNAGVGIMLFIAGVVAISAMVLPGISGSTVLMIFGLYVPITTAIKDVLHLKFEYVPALVIFGIGVIVGALAVVKLIKKQLEFFRAHIVHFIIGMMIGSIYSIAMGPTTLRDSAGNLKNLKMLNFSSFSIIYFIIGGVIILGLQFLKVAIESKEA